VKDAVKKLENFTYNIFDEERKQQWLILLQQFNTQVEQIDGQVVTLIRSTFEDNLTSSEGAFELLAKFQDVKTRKCIKDLLQEKYDDVLVCYEKELEQMEHLYKTGEKSPPISKNMP